MKRCLLLICLIHFGIAHAQNLIPNGGFEDMKKCPKALGQLDRVAFWSSPNTGTPDYFNKCFVKNFETVGVPNNFFGTRDAFEGAGYAGILCGNQEKEFLQINLAEPLVAGRAYCLRFRAAAPSPSSDGRMALRACFLDTSLTIPNWDLLDIPVATQLNANWKMGPESIGWAMFTKTYTAKGGEKTLVVGHFAAIDYRAYTYLDAFELYESTSKSGCESELFVAEDEDPNNLVPNSGFEQLFACPKQREDLQNARAWRIKQNSPDFYHVCGTGTAAVPKNELGEQMPHNGNGYGGIWAMLQERQNYREFVATRLKTPLIAGKKYCLSIWVSLAEVSDHALDELQLQITRDDQGMNNCQVGVDTTELITLSNGKILDNWNEWVFLHGTFIAKGDEQTIMIGNYRGNADSHMHRLENGPKKGIQFKDCCYYYIDDVGLHGVGDPTCSCPGSQPEPIPTTMTEPADSHVTTGFQEFKAGDTLVLRNLQFEFDKSRLLPKSLPLLDSLADFLKSHPDLKIRLSGHTDSDGEDGYNLKLSESRARAVMDYLISQTIDAKRITSFGIGESRPCSTNETDEGKALNRRVEVEFLEE